MKMMTPKAIRQRLVMISITSCVRRLIFPVKIVMLISPPSSPEHSAAPTIYVSTSSATTTSSDHEKFTFALKI